MKTLFYILIPFLITAPSFACRNVVPQSVAQSYIDAAAMGQSVPGGKSCKELSEEPCLCFDSIEGWDVARIEGGKLVNDLDKLAAKRQKAEVEASNAEIASEKKRLAKERIKAFDRTKSYTNAQLKEFIGDLIDASK